MLGAKVTEHALSFSASERGQRTVPPARKEIILAAAARLFAEKGFAEVSTAEVAELAGVAHGTLFYHFKNKEGILLAVYEGMIEAYVAGMETARKAASTGLDGLLGAARFHFRFSAERSQELRLLMRDVPSRFAVPGSPHHARVAAHNERLLGVFRRGLAAGLADGSIRQVPLEATAHILRGLLYGTSRQRLLGPLEVPPLEAALLDFCRTALAV